MARGKYSVLAYIDNTDDMNYNAQGQRRPEGLEISKGFNPETDLYEYDHEGKFVDGYGVDRAGWTRV